MSPKSTQAYFFFFGFFHAKRPRPTYRPGNYDECFYCQRLADFLLIVREKSALAHTHTTSCQTYTIYLYVYEIGITIPSSPSPGAGCLTCIYIYLYINIIIRCVSLQKRKNTKCAYNNAPRVPNVHNVIRYQISKKKKNVIYSTELLVVCALQV